MFHTIVGLAAAASLSFLQQPSTGISEDAWWTSLLRSQKQSCRGLDQLGVESSHVLEETEAPLREE
jgi:hypothetical protein